MPEEKGTDTRMVTQLCDKLTKATAGSEFVVAVFCDIRGFSEFSKTVESAQTATFLKHFYLKLLRDYFKNAAFAKPNGDGLLMIFQYDDESLKAVSADILANCFKALKDFPEMFKSLPAINFATPKAIGFGIARGSASFLALDNERLDYSGKLLNLAARLTALARPEGIVIDGNYQIGTIPVKLKGQFRSANVYLKGIAEADPIEVLYPKSVVVLPPEAFYPLKDYTWKKETVFLKVSELSDVGSRYIVEMPEQPLGMGMIKVQHNWPNPKFAGKRVLLSTNSFELRQDASGYKVSVHLDEIQKWAKAAAYPPDTVVAIEVHYVPKPQSLPAKQKRKMPSG